MTEKRRKAIIRRRVFVAILAVMLALIIALLAIIINGSKNVTGTDNPSETLTSDTQEPSVQNKPTEVEEQGYIKPNGPEYVTVGDVKLNAELSRLLLTNAKNPLPEEYDTNVLEYLVEIDPQYRTNDNYTQIHKDVYPYITAMVAAAQSEGVGLLVRSPFRDYATQEGLFNRQVAYEAGLAENAGATQQQLEAMAATVVVRPGTSEHNTGLCADFNLVDNSFEQTAMFTWLQENAQDYGFVLRYPEGKEDITGIIYEPWHWRFVGINAAKEMNELGMTLEEYVEYKNLEPTVDMYSDDK